MWSVWTVNSLLPVQYFVFSLCLLLLYIVISFFPVDIDACHRKRKVGAMLMKKTWMLMKLLKATFDMKYEIRQTHTQTNQIVKLYDNYAIATFFVCHSRRITNNHKKANLEDGRPNYLHVFARFDCLSQYESSSSSSTVGIFEGIKEFGRIEVSIS